MKLTYEPNGNVAYVHLGDKETAAKTIRLGDAVNVDLSSDGNVVGIQLLDARRQLNAVDRDEFVVENRDNGERQVVRFGVASGRPGAMAPEQSLLDEFVRRILSVVRPLRIVLFGSAARGEMSTDSDLDFLVVMPEGTNRRECATELHGAARGLHASCDFVVATPADLERRSESKWSALYEAVHEGKELYRAQLA